MLRGVQGEVRLEYKALLTIHGQNAALPLMFTKHLSRFVVTKQPSCSPSQANPSRPLWLHGAFDAQWYITLDHWHPLSAASFDTPAEVFREGDFFSLSQHISGHLALKNN